MLPDGLCKWFMVILTTSPFGAFSSSLEAVPNKKMSGQAADRFIEIRSAPKDRNATASSSEVTPRMRILARRLASS